MEAIQQELISLLIVVITVASGVVATYVTRYAKSKGVVASLEGNKQLVKIVVSGVEQAYKHLGGPEKFEQAKKDAVEMMKSKGIKVNEKELDHLIESVVKEVKESSKEELNKK